PDSSRAPEWIHCHTWERAISAVAVSSIRFEIVTAPAPRSQDSMYVRDTRTLLRRPANVGVPGTRRSRSSTGETLLSFRNLSIWFGADVRTRPKTSFATGTRSG